MKNCKHKIIIVFLAALLLAGAVWGYFYFRDRDRRLLRALTDELETIVAKRPGKSNALALLDAATPERVFASKVEIASDSPRLKRIFSLKELSQILITMKKSCSSAALDIDISEITIDADRLSATVTGTAVFSGNTGKGDIREVRDAVLNCSKIDGRWKICKLTVTPVIKR